MSKNHYRVIDWHKFSGRPRDADDRYTVVGIQDVELSGERGKQIEAATVYDGGSGDVARSIADHTRMELESVRPYIWWDNDEADGLIATLREHGHTVLEVVRNVSGFMMTTERKNGTPYLSIRLKDTKMERPDSMDTGVNCMDHLRLMVEVGAEVFVEAERGFGNKEVAKRIFHRGDS